MQQREEPADLWPGVHAGGARTSRQGLKLSCHLF
jgi:hypothetical protein